MLVIDLDITIEDDDPMSFLKNQTKVNFINLKIESSPIYSAVVENQLVAISAMLAGVVPCEQLNRLDLQIVGRHC
jgi:hypothetical protein